MNLYLMAHQDDEFFCLPQIRRDITSGVEVLILYLTNGGGGKALPVVRDRETVNVLKKIGVDPSSIVFLGSQISIPDGELYLNMDRIYKRIKCVIQEKRVNSVYFPCYEGGHQDHDAISWIVAKLFDSSLPRCYQFPLYNAYQICSPFFKVMKNIEYQNESESFFVFNFSDIKYLLNYKSQFRTWLGLTPFIVTRMIFSRKISLISFRNSYLLVKPHEGDLLYEKRTSVTYQNFVSKMKEFMEGL